MSDQTNEIQPIEISEQDKAKARKWFAQGKTVADTKNFDYAVECYINGLNLWPEAVEEGHGPLRFVGVARQHGGGKKPSFKDSVKHSMTGKDTKKAMLNAELLLAKDPMNPTYMEGLLRNAGKARCEETVLWIGPILYSAIAQEKKPNIKRMQLLATIYHELGDRRERREEVQQAIEAYEKSLEVTDVLARLQPTNQETQTAKRNLASKLTILKGKYDTNGSFTESVRDAETQRDIHDRARSVQADDRLEELVKKAEADIKANPEVISKVFDLVDLLCKQEKDEQEKKAIGILMDKYKSINHYPLKMRADDIRMRQVHRRIRRLTDANQKDKARELARQLMVYEIKVFKERVKEYPTDLRHKFELAKRLFRGRKFDDAIPLLQAAQQDPKNRFACWNFIGRCFFEKGYFSESANVIRQAIEAYEGTPTDETSKELHYWLARSCEGDSDTEEARKIYGQLIQWDYNYRDVRDRMERLKTAQD